MAVQNYLTLSHLRKAVASITQKIISDLAGLTDTSITSPTNGQALLYDSTSSKWKNEDLPKAVFLVTITENIQAEETTYISDKTYSQIETALNNGLIPVCSYDGEYIGLTYVENDSFGFCGSITLMNLRTRIEPYQVKIFISSDNTIDVEIDEDISLPNMRITELTNSQILQFDSTSGYWVNSDLPTIPAASKTIPSSDGTGAVGVSTAYARADHVHPKITQTISISSNVITLTGSDGTTSSVTIPTSGGTSGASSLSELNDTTITSPSDGQILRYDNSSSKWINSNETTYTFDGTYNASTNKAATVSTVTDAIGALTIPTKTSDLTNDSGFMTGMTILSYGHSTWADFIDAYTNKRVVYCRASSASNPATGSQTRLAFMAYVNNADNPTEVEFQYYRSVNGHTDAQQGDQVYIYKLNKSSGWTVTVREAYTKIITGTGLSKSYSNGISASMTLSLDSTKTATTSANGLMSSTDKSRLDTLYADYSSALTALGVN